MNNKGILIGSSVAAMLGMIWLVFGNESFKAQLNFKDETSALVEFGFTTYTTDGRFAGKLSTERTLQNLGEEGFDIEIALDTFLPWHPKFGAPVTGMEIRDWWCATRDQQAHLVITHVELLTTSP